MFKYLFLALVIMSQTNLTFANENIDNLQNFFNHELDNGSSIATELFNIYDEGLSFNKSVQLIDFPDRSEKVMIFPNRGSMLNESRLSLSCIKADSENASCKIEDSFKLLDDSNVIFGSNLYLAKILDALSIDKEVGYSNFGYKVQCIEVELVHRLPDRPKKGTGNFNCKIIKL